METGKPKNLDEMKVTTGGGQGEVAAKLVGSMLVKVCLQAIMSRLTWEDEMHRIALEGHAVLERTADSLARSQRTAAETERVGDEVVSELSAQREALLRSRQRLADTDHELSQTHILLRKMTLHVLTNKIILIIIILLELCILAAVCYIRFFSS